MSWKGDSSISESCVSSSSMISPGEELGPSHGLPSKPQQPRQMSSCGSMLRFRPARDGSTDFGGARNCSSWRARSGGRSLNFGCRCPTGACHTAASAKGCRDADDTGAFCAKAPLAANARIAAQIAASRMTVVLFAWNVSMEREFRNHRRQTLDGLVPRIRRCRLLCSDGARHRLVCFAVLGSVLRRTAIQARSLLCEETRAIVVLCAPQGGIGHDIANHIRCQRMPT
jgi:hypothetical protein